MKAKKQTRCVVCGKDMSQPKRWGFVPGWIFDMKYGMTKKNVELFKTQLGSFDFLLDPAVGEINLCWECYLKSLGMTPERVKAILGGTFR